jgi:hypothetical protein
MPRLDEYFREETRAPYDHPLLRYLEELRARPDFRDARVEVRRPRAPLGYEPAKLYLHFYAKSGAEMDRPQPEEWDDELNTALIERHVKATDLDNEKIRFSLGLRASLQGPEAKYGDGYYNGVLVHHIEHTAFKDYPGIAEVLRHVYRSGIDPSFRSYSDCRSMIDGAIRGRAQELTKLLGYGVPEAEEILAVALAQYLDERFSVSNRRALGLL